jgi:hypothetical protein
MWMYFYQITTNLLDEKAYVTILYFPSQQNKYWCHHAVTTTLAGPDLGSQLKSVESLVCTQMMPWCSGWGSKPTWNGSHIHSKHIRSDWQPSYTVDEDMEESSCSYHHSCWPRFGESAQIMGPWCARIMLSWCSGWGSKPTWNGSHGISKHILQGHWHLNIMWMGVWRSHHAVTTTLAGTDLRSQLKAVFLVGPQMMPWHSDFSWISTWNGSHIHCKHTQGHWQLSFSVDWSMDPSSCRYHHYCWPRFEKSAEICVTCVCTNDAMAQWLRL